MTDDRELSLILDRWLDDGPTEMPDRVIDVVALGISRQRQRPAWRLDWRHLTMNPLAKAGAAIAAVVLVAAIGYTLLPGNRSGVGAPAPTAVPSATPTTVPTAKPTARPTPAASSAVFPEWYTPNPEDRGAGILTAGSHTTTSFQPVLTYAVPAGWVNHSDATYFGLFPDTPVNQAEFARSDEPADSILMGSIDSPYFVCKGLENYRGTAAEMAAAAAANEILVVSDVVDVTVGGLSGKRFDVRVSPDWDGNCPGDPPGSNYLDGRTRVFFLDAPGRGAITIFVGSMHAADHEAFVTSATPVVESFDFSL
jgi:hypothetical protein